MKLLLKIFSFCLLITAVAAPVIAQGNDSLKTAAPVLAAADSNATYVIDGVPSSNKLNGITQKDIAFAGLINKQQAEKMFNGTAKNGLVLIITKQQAIKLHQKKFANYSPEYENYLAMHKGTGNELTYFMNGRAFTHSDVAMNAFYNLPEKNIQAVALAEKKDDRGVVSTIVIIETKE